MHNDIAAFKRAAEILEQAEEILIRKGVSSKKPVRDNNVYLHELNTNEGVGLTYCLYTNNPISEPLTDPKIKVEATFGTGLRATVVTWYYEGATFYEDDPKLNKPERFSVSFDENVLNSIDRARQLQQMTDRCLKKSGSRSLSKKDAFAILQQIAILVASQRPRTVPPTPPDGPTV
jgi:hypothetical protein